MNRLAIGRFLHELTSDIKAAMDTGKSGTATSAASKLTPTPHNKAMLIYSGHDYTLVPIMCALGIYDGKI